MPVFDSGVCRTAFSASRLSPRCARVWVEAHSPDTRSAGWDTQRHSPEKRSPADNPENRRMMGREGCPKPSGKVPVLLTLSWAC